MKELISSMQSSFATEVDRNEASADIAGRSIECGFLECLPKHEEYAPLESRPASQVPKEKKE
jgi:hypothetical protein